MFLLSAQIAVLVRPVYSTIHRSGLSPAVPAVPVVLLLRDGVNLFTAFLTPTARLLAMGQKDMAGNRY